jgi:hypothetical protein
MPLRAPARWAVLLAGHIIVFRMVGRVPGVNYPAAGLRTRYRYRGRVYSVVAWSAAVACVTKSFGKSVPARTSGTGSRPR